MKKAVNSEKELLAALVVPYSEETTLMEDLAVNDAARAKINARFDTGEDATFCTWCKRQTSDGPDGNDLCDACIDSQHPVQDNLPGEDYASRESIIDLTYNPETGVWE